MFRPLWEPVTVGRLEGYARADPRLSAGLKSSVETLDIELTDRADTWGESRSGSYRLGYVGILSALVRVDPDRRIVWVVDVQLQVRRPPAA